jgi:hypothetical protein
VTVAVSLLDKLVEWGNLTRIRDTSAATSLSEFAPRRSLYQLTRAGEAAHRTVEQFLAGVDRGGTVSRRALNDVLEDLTALAVAAASAVPDPARVATVLATCSPISTSWPTTRRRPAGARLRAALDRPQPPGR